MDEMKIYRRRPSMKKVALCAIASSFLVLATAANAHSAYDGSRTRFIPDRLLGLFEKTVWPLAVASAAARASSQGPRIDVGARMRGMWR
jgi:hypothetical protein